MTSTNIQWTELWRYTDGQHIGELQLRAFDDGTFDVASLDGQVLDRFTTYDEADIWLTDDEYHFVRRNAPASGR